MPTNPNLYGKVDKPGAIGSCAVATSGNIYLEAKSVQYPHFKLRFGLDKARVPVTDAGAGGSFGSLRLFDFIAQAVGLDFSRANILSVVEGAALTTNAGDAAYKLAVGTVAVAAAADNALTGNNVDLGSAISITNVAGTGVGTAVTAINKAVDGTTTPASIFLNFSGSAASIDANSFLDVTGDITITGIMLDDD